MAMDEEQTLPSVDTVSVAEFEKDLKNLGKKFRKIYSDLDVAIEVIKAEPIHSQRCEPIQGLGAGTLTHPFFLKM